MIQRREHFGLALEACEAIRIARDRGREYPCAGGRGTLPIDDRPIANCWVIFKIGRFRESIS